MPSEGTGSLRFLRDLDLHVVADDANLMATDLDTWVIRPDAVGDAKAPGVPGAGDDAVFDIAAGERRAHVRAAIVDGGRLAVEKEHGDEPMPDRHGLAFAFLQIMQLAHRVI